MLHVCDVSRGCRSANQRGAWAIRVNTTREAFPPIFKKFSTLEGNVFDRISDTFFSKRLSDRLDKAIEEALLEYSRKENRLKLRKRTK